MRRGNALVACVCLSACLFVRAVSFESIDLETSFVVCWYIFSMSTSSSYIKVIGSRSRPQEQKRVSVRLVRGGLPSTERQSCCYIIWYVTWEFSLLTCAETCVTVRTVRKIEFRVISLLGLFVFILFCSSYCFCASKHSHYSQRQQQVSVLCTLSLCGRQN